MKITDLRDKEIIHCKTKPEAKRICKMIAKAGFVWFGGQSFVITNWEKFKEKTCYNHIEGKYSSKEVYEQHNYTIHSSTLF